MNLNGHLLNTLQRILNSKGYCIEKRNYITKQNEELSFWSKSINQFKDWYYGIITSLYDEPSPKALKEGVIKTYDFDALIAWQNTHQKRKYLEDLSLPEDAFKDLTVLDIGSGPFPSALAFKNCNIFCLDPLLPEYIRAGYPIHIYEDRLRFVYGFAEDLPFPDHFFDAIISVNAIDHVDDFIKTVNEIKRVLKVNGKIRLHIHYHKKSKCEPIELNDSIITNSFSWCRGFRKISESKNKRGHQLEDLNESYALWSNF